MALGIVLQFLFSDKITGLSHESVQSSLQILGSLGLVFIVLEGALDLKLTKGTSSLAIKAFISALLIFTLTTFVITLIFNFAFNLPLQNALIYAIPLSIISSAIAIPTALHLIPEKKEFILYESTFSDIIGIVTFNYVIFAQHGLSEIPLKVLLDFIITIPIIIVLMLATLVFMNIANAKVKLIPILGILIWVYAATKLLHLPSLLLVLVFGLTLKNIRQLPLKVTKYFSVSKLESATDELNNLTTEISFFVRTFFFIAFGYTLQIGLLKNAETLLVGGIVFISIYVIRYLSLKKILKISFAQELFIAPRGLVTIILLFSIPESLVVNSFNVGVVYFVIIASSLTLLLSLKASNQSYTELNA